jgi:hypothetical protein
MPKTLPAGHYATVMGDLVMSGSASSFEELHAKFNTAINQQNRIRRAALVSPLTITLGDEFQGLSKTLVDSLSIVRALRLDLLARGVDCRFAIGVAEIQTPVNVARAWNMMGSGLAQTREKLNEKSNDTVYRFALSDHRVIESTLEALGAGLTAIERRWTPRQLKDISASLAGTSAREIAKLRNVSAHSVYKVRSSGEFDLYVYQWSAISEALAHLDQLYGLT